MYRETPSVYLVKNIENGEPEWIKLAQISTQNQKSEECKLINQVMDAIKIDTITTKEGAEGYFIRAVDPDNKLFDSKKRPTILHIHGGPHGGDYKDFFSHIRLLWISLGYNLFVVNYRGSLGFGLKHADALSGKVFDVDVNDCLDLLQLCIDTFSDEVDTDNLGVEGGSHGGYLTCCLISHPEWCDKFAAACIWNPVTAMHAAVVFSDIPDWHYSVALNKPHQWILTKEDMNVMFDKSPINRVQNVKTPSLFIMGGDDKRAPPHQGMYFWKGLQALGVETEMHYYGDQGHAIPDVEKNIDAYMNMTNWWIKHFNKA